MFQFKIALYTRHEHRQKVAVSIYYLLDPAYILLEVIFDHTGTEITTPSTLKTMTIVVFLTNELHFFIFVWGNF